MSEGIDFFLYSLGELLSAIGESWSIISLGVFIYAICSGIAKLLRIPRGLRIQFPTNVSHSLDKINKTLVKISKKLKEEKS